MISQQGQQALFSAWDLMGPSVGVSKYFSESFSTWEEYYKLLAKYYKIKGGVDGLKSHIIDEANQMLSSNNSPCEGVTIRMYDIGLEERMTSVSAMLDYQTKGHGSNRYSYFAYTEPEDWECPDELMDNTYTSTYECFDDKCLYETISNITSYIRKKYGIGLNVEVTPESRMRGNIKIDTWQ